ncbi:MAG: ATP-binding domain-containing protein [Symploca sp. SIO3E6]|nr:ATP-binding domain-containing protein [Caldora sp. SIO3E6]
MLDIVYGSVASIATSNLLDSIRSLNLDGTLYIGYPVVASADESLTIDSLLICQRHGVVVFDISSAINQAGDWSRLEEQQDDLYRAILSKLSKHKKLFKRRDLAVSPNVVTFLPTPYQPPEDIEVTIACSANLASVLSEFDSISPEYIKPVNAALERVSTIKPTKKRQSVKQSDSRGAKLKKIEEQIANLDQWQKQAAIESPDSPQRIRGLAGSGKTIVLALKAAYWHTQHPDWTIALTFHTRSLYQQFQDLIRRFCFESIEDEPDWKKLKIIHSWGSSAEPGMYSEIAALYSEDPKDFRYGKSKYSQSRAFEGICRELLEVVKERKRECLYDAVLIDEAQDLPIEFFQLVYEVVPEPKRIVFAYDDLQNLGSYAMLPPDKLFGTDENGKPYVQLRNIEGEPKQDIVLQKCYRNTPWALATAHALGFGIYREDGLVQMFDDPGTWTQVGYEVIEGDLAPGKRVTVMRRKDYSPSFFEEKLKPEDAVYCATAFENQVQQAEWVAKNIQTNLQEDELEASDILIIIPDALKLSLEASWVIQALQNRGLKAHIAGKTSSKDRLFFDDSIAITSIFRAKGNEAPMVYILSSEYCFEGLELATKRNILFTAITRSRAWVRICGCGSQMQGLKVEIDKVFGNQFKLSFTVPTEQQLDTMRRVNRDVTPGEKAKIEKDFSDLRRVAERIQKGEVHIDNIPKDLRSMLSKALREKSETNL